MLTIGLIILEQAFLYFPLIFGAYLSFSLMKLPDLSLESSYTFGAILASRVIALEQFDNPFFATVSVIITSLLGGLFVGLISSSFTQLTRIPHLLSSILTIGLFHGINQYVLGHANFSLSRFMNPLIISDKFVRNPELPFLLITFLLLIGIGLFLLRTQLGYAFAVYGDNPLFFKHHNISTNYVVIVGVGLANALAGLSGYLVAQSSGFVDIHAGSGMALFCISTLVLGKAACSFFKSFSIIIPVSGILGYCVIQQLLLKVGFNLKYFTMLQSFIVLLILINKFRKFGSLRSGVDNLGV